MVINHHQTTTYFLCNKLHVLVPMDHPHATYNMQWNFLGHRAASRREGFPTFRELTQAQNTTYLMSQIGFKQTWCGQMKRTFHAQYTSVFGDKQTQGSKW